MSAASQITTKRMTLAMTCPDGDPGPASQVNGVCARYVPLAFVKLADS